MRGIKTTCRGRWALIVALTVGSGAVGCGTSEITNSGTKGGPIDDVDFSAVVRGGSFLGASERFNRYYTDPSYTPTRVLYVSRQGGGDGTTRQSPTDPESGIAQAGPGTQITFLADSEPYEGCFELAKEDVTGTYDEPIVLFAERNEDGSRGVTVDCCSSGRETCLNVEFADYVAVDGFILRGGRYGLRAVGEGYEPSKNQLGVAMLNNEGFGQCADPFFTAQSSWFVVENNIAHDAGDCDGHGIYLSNGGDYLIARGNEAYNNPSSDFQINADPITTCSDEGISYDDERCYGSVLDGQGQGASEFVLFEGNYLHHGLAQGPNLTSVRNSIFRNNIIGPYEEHGTSFWQETSNPELGSSGNLIHHNLFMGTGRKHLLEFIVDSKDNQVKNNLFVALSDEPIFVTSEAPNEFAGNFYVGSGLFEGHAPTQLEFLEERLGDWFFVDPRSAFDASAFRPKQGAPFVGVGELVEATPMDIEGERRSEPTTAGPYRTPQ